jgi:hypothetical protein
MACIKQMLNAGISMDVRNARKYYEDAELLIQTYDHVKRGFGQYATLRKPTSLGRQYIESEELINKFADSMSDPQLEGLRTQQLCIYNTIINAVEAFQCHVESDHELNGIDVLYEDDIDVATWYIKYC